MRAYLHGFSDFSVPEVVFTADDLHIVNVYIVFVFDCVLSNRCKGALVSVVVCSSNLTDIALAVSPTYVSLQSEQLILYTTPHLSQSGVLSFGCTKKDLIVLIGLWYALTPWSLKILLSFSEIPLM